MRRRRVTADDLPDIEDELASPDDSIYLHGLAAFRARIAYQAHARGDRETAERQLGWARGTELNWRRQHPGETNR